jgi:hypothetical protein
LRSFLRPRTKSVTSVTLGLFLLFGSFLGAVAQEERAPAKTNLTVRHPIPNGSHIFIAEMEGSLHTYIASEITKKKLPVIIVTDEKNADYVISGATLKGDNKWYHTVLGTGKDKNEGNIQVVSVKERTVIWAGEAGDRSMIWGRFSRGGKSKVASRLVGKMKKELFAK